MLSRGLTLERKQRNVFVAGEFCFVILYVLLFVVVEVNSGMFARGGE